MTQKNNNTSRSSRIYQYVKMYTRAMLDSNETVDNGVDAKVISLDLHLDRANVSKELNILWKNGKLTKIQGKPILFIDYDEITATYPSRFIPSIIAKGKSLKDFIEFEKPIQDFETQQIHFDTIIGSNGSLSEQIQRAKAAVSYPPFGLHTLLTGSMGVGKMQFAKDMFEYAVHLERKDKNAGFFVVNCHDYNNSAQLLAMQLFGAAKGSTISNNDKSRKGLIELANGGIIYFDGIDRLSSKSQEIIISLIEKGTYSRLGESVLRPLDAMLIASTTAQINSETIAPLAKYIPVTIHLPDIDKRGVYEKIEIILDFFSQEAKATNCPIRVHKDIIICFASMKYRENLNQIKSEIKLACSKAYLDILDCNTKTMYISYQHLSNDLLAFNENNSILKTSAISILSSLPNDYILFDNFVSSTSITYLRTAPLLYGDRRMNQFINEFNTELENITNLDEYITENIAVLQNCGNAQIVALKNSIHPFVFQSVFNKLQASDKYEKITRSTHLLYGALLHLSNILKRVDNGIPLPKTLSISTTKDLYPNEYKFSSEIFDIFKKVYQINFPESEIDFFTVYLAIANQWVNKTVISILIVCHGDSTATDYLNYIRNSISGDYVIDAINYTSTMQLNDLLELACLKAVELNQGAGVLIVSDIEPLTSVHDYVYRTTKIKARTLSPISLPLLINIVEKSMNQSYSLDTLAVQSEVQKQSESTVKESLFSPFIERLTNEFLSKTLTFLNPIKATEVLMLSLNKILEDLNQPYSDEIAVKFLSHSVHMLERIIKKEPLAYVKLKQFTSSNNQIFNTVERNLSYTAEVFGVIIPSSEVAYITEIFQEIL